MIPPAIAPFPPPPGLPPSVTMAPPVVSITPPAPVAVKAIVAPFPPAAVPDKLAPRAKVMLLAEETCRALTTAFGTPTAPLKVTFPPVPAATLIEPFPIVWPKVTPAPLANKPPWVVSTVNAKPPRFIAAFRS